MQASGLFPSATPDPELPNAGNSPYAGRPLLGHTSIFKSFLQKKVLPLL